MVEVPHVEYIERVEEIRTHKTREKIVHVPKIEITERVIEIPKYSELIKKTRFGFYDGLYLQ